jgi:hypothetical protein
MVKPLGKGMASSFGAEGREEPFCCPIEEIRPTEPAAET